MTRPAVFIDKDGTLVHDVPHNVDPALVEFTPHAAEAIRLLDAAGYAVVVVTNQPGLATGRFTRRDFARLEAALTGRLLRESGVAVAGFYCCPHAPGPDLKPACLCRKPAPGMLRQAARALDLDLATSWLVGDILDDVEAGRRAGCRTVLLDVGNETEWHLTPIRRPEHRVADLREAAHAILGLDRPAAQRAAGAAGRFEACG